MVFVLLQHAVALKAAAVTQPLHDLHQTNLAVKGNMGWKTSNEMNG